MSVIRELAAAILVTVSATLTLSVQSWGAPKAYIGSNGSDNVTVIDTGTDTVVTTIPVGDGPWGIAAHPDGSRVYVVNNNSDSVSIINTATDTVIGTIMGVGTCPFDVAFKPDGTRAYVSDPCTINLYVIDTSTSAVLGFVPNAAREAIVVTPDGSRVYACDGNNIRVVDTTSNTVVATIADGSHHDGIDVSPDGQFVYTNRHGVGVTVISTATNSVVTSIPGNVYEGVSVSPDGTRVYASMGNNDAVGVIDGGTNIGLTSFSVGDFPWGSSVTPDGSKLYVANYSGGTVSVVSTATNGVIATIPVGSFPISRGKFIAAESTTTSTSTSSTTSTTLAPTDLMPGRVALIKAGTLAKFVAKPVPGDTFALPMANPSTAGGSLAMFDVGVTAGHDTYLLPAGAAWKGLGNPPGSKGYKYKGAGTPGDPCKVVIAKPKVFKALCIGPDMTLAPPFSGGIGIVLNLGSMDRYCAQFGGEEVRNDSTLTKRKNALAPAACPNVPTTTSSSSSTSLTSTTSSSTTTTSLMSGCFTATGDGTIHDTCTGLQWEKKSYFGLSNLENRYSWAGCCNGSCGSVADLCQPTAGAAALCAAHSDGGTEGCNTCSSGTCVVNSLGDGAITTVWEWLRQLNAANFAGHSDWRLPSEGARNSPSTGTNELETILAGSFPCGQDPCINSIFGPTKSLYYWSASTYSASTFNAWRVAFVNGAVSNEDKRAAGDRYVRAVRDE